MTTIDERLIEAEGRIEKMDAAFHDLLKWRIVGRAAVKALPPPSEIEDAKTKGYVQACDQAIEDIRRAASGCGIDLE